MLEWIEDLRGEIGAVGDQGERGTCLAWAGSAAHQMWHACEELCVEHLHWSCGNTTAGAGTVQALAESLTTVGQPPEWQWPYDPVVEGRTPPADLAGPFRKSGLQTLSGTVESIFDRVANRQAVILGIRVTDEFLGCRSGFVGGSSAGSGGHAVVAVGAARYRGVPTDELSTGDRVLCVRNSWGDTWGVEGYALVSESAIDACLIVAAVIE